MSNSIIEKTVLITGAGASANYGLPTGGELIRMILLLKEKPDPYKIYESFQNKYPNKLNSFKKNLNLFRKSHIDYLLRNYKNEYGDIGRYLIARNLLGSEKDLFKNIHMGTSNDEYDDWLSTLISILNEKVTKPGDLEEISKNLTIITFNYDLSMEYFLQEYCKGTGEWGDALEEFKKNLKIIHIYGKLGKFDWEKNNNIYSDEMFKSFAKFKSKLSSEDLIERKILDKNNNDFVFYNDLIEDELVISEIEKISKGIKVIGDKNIQVDLKHIQVAKNLIKEAKKIFFLGFGFNRCNLSLLGFAERSGKISTRRDIQHYYCNSYDEDPYIKKIYDCLEVKEDELEKPSKYPTEKEISTLLRLYL